MRYALVLVALFGSLAACGSHRPAVAASQPPAPAPAASSSHPSSPPAAPSVPPPPRSSSFGQVDGYDPGPLGVLSRQKYFNGGVAVHGFPDVPPYPASHGCVRVTDAAMDWLWATGRTPVGRPVWVY